MIKFSSFKKGGDYGKCNVQLLRESECPKWCSQCSLEIHHASIRYVGVVSQEMREEMMEMFKNKGNF